MEKPGGPPNPGLSEPKNGGNNHGPNGKHGMRVGSGENPDHPPEESHRLSKSLPFRVFRAFSG